MQSIVTIRSLHEAASFRAVHEPVQPLDSSGAPSGAPIETRTVWNLIGAFLGEFETDMEAIVHVDALAGDERKQATAARVSESNLLVERPGGFSFVESIVGEDAEIYQLREAASGEVVGALGWIDAALKEVALRDRQFLENKKSQSVGKKM